MLFMITSLILVLIRQYQKKHPQQFNAFIGKAFFFSRLVALLIVCLLLSIQVKPQERELNFTIKRNGSDVGKMVLKEIKTGTRTSYKLHSDITATILFSFNLKANEEAVYVNGILQSSFVHRYLNGNEKSNKNTRLAGDIYLLNKKGSEQKTLSSIIRYNTLSMYTQEPVLFTAVYSDSFQQFVPIQKINLNHYKVVFPDGNYNEYFYDNGIVAKIKLNNSLFKAEVELNK
jgi:hypothetical protein